MTTISRFWQDETRSVEIMVMEFPEGWRFVVNYFVGNKVRVVYKSLFSSQQDAINEIEANSTKL